MAANITSLITQAITWAKTIVVGVADVVKMGFTNLLLDTPETGSPVIADIGYFFLALFVVGIVFGIFWILMHAIKLGRKG